MCKPRRADKTAMGALPVTAGIVGARFSANLHDSMEGGMRAGSLFVAAVATSLLATPISAVGQRDVDDCGRHYFTVEATDADRVIAACTRIIDASSEALCHRFVAYHNRGMAYFVKEDYDRAIADHTEGIRLDPTNPISYWMRS